MAYACHSLTALLMVVVAISAATPNAKPNQRAPHTFVNNQRLYHGSISSPKGLAYFSLGCFWGSEYSFECAGLDVKPKYLAIRSLPDRACNTTLRTLSDHACLPASTVVGYMGGIGEYPTYSNYTAGNNYSETVRVEYNEKLLTYEDLLELFWMYTPDPTVPYDDPAYQLRMFVTDEAQYQAANASIAQRATELGHKLYVDIYPATQYNFWKAEEYHQQRNFKAGLPCEKLQV